MIVLILLRVKLKKLDSESFKDEINSIYHQNYTFIFTSALYFADAVMVSTLGEPLTWTFNYVLIDLICIAALRIIWDIHFILVHRRVFRETISLAQDDPLPITTNNSNDKDEYVVELMLSPKHSSNISSNDSFNKDLNITHHESDALKKLLEATNSMGTAG